MTPKSDWKWFGHAGHLCVGHWCRFHLATQVGPWLVSTVGEYWPERPVREIHAKCEDPQWLAANILLKGDRFDAAYMKRFRFEEIGYGRTYESMVFKAGKPCDADMCGHCGIPEINGSEQDSQGYNSAREASQGHMELCERWAQITEEANARSSED